MDKTDLLATLSKPGALEILRLAEQGIVRSVDAMRELGLSQKVYYTRLRALVDVGLIVGREGIYRLTALGRIVQRHILPILGRAFEEKTQLKLLDELEAADVDDEVRKTVAEALESHGIVGLIDSEAGISPVRIVDDYEVLAGELVKCIEKAERSILLATNYIDLRIADAGLKALKRGVRIRTLSEGGGASSGLSRLRMVLSPKIFEGLIYYLSNLKDIGEVARDTDVPYSFSVIDGSLCFFELPNPSGGVFSVGFIVKNPHIGAIFTDIFEGLWENARPNALLGLAKKLNG